MSPSSTLHFIRPVLFTVALSLVLTLAAGAAPPPAPFPLTTDATYPNLFYGAVPPNAAKAPVVVFVHGLGGNFQDWIESHNCPTSVTGCVGSNNDMYDYMYQAGYRTVFMSLNADNTNNNLSIQTNAAMLQTLFPEILSQTGVSKVYFVCHSKGGLDLEDAIANPKWIGIATAVIELGTPNQGDALADWLYSPAGEGLQPILCPTPNAPGCLFNPAVQSLEIANVLQLRNQWDPIFQNAHIPFYTVSGNTYTCGGPPTCPTVVTGPILTSVTGNSTAPPNDGLVTHPETLLPSTYAMELGILYANHYLLRMGDNSFNFINGRITELQNQQPGFTMVGNGGFGDQHNNWAWSMAWFNNMLYVGTGREPNCITAAASFIQIGAPGLYPPNIGDCTPDYHYLPLQAEIWQYNPATNLWTNVFQSPNSLSTPDNKGKLVATARDVGFRGLTVVNEPGGVQALYAGGVTSGEIFECHPPTITTNCAAQGTWPPPRILRSTDGVTWNPIPQNGTLTTVNGSSSWTPAQCGSSPCFLGSLTANGTYVKPAYPNYSIRSAAQLCSTPGPNCVHDGTFFLQVGDFPGVGRVIAATPGTNPALGDNCGQPICYTWASPSTIDLPVWILDNFNNFMYAGTGSPAITGTKQEYGVYSTSGLGTPPYTWNPIITSGGYAQNLIADFAMSMEIFSDPTYCPGIGCLYVGTDRPNEMVRIHPDATGQVYVDATDSWDLIVGNPRNTPANQYVYPLSGIGQYFDNGFTGHFWRMGVGGQGLYMGTWDMSSDNVPNCGTSTASCTFGQYWSQEYGTDLWRSPDGVRWTFVSKTGLGDGNNTGSRSFAATPFGLFMGTAREVGGAQVFNVDNTSLDFNHDGVIDANDVRMMMARVNAKVSANDPMDLNRDGKITQKDVQLLMTQCKHPNCAVTSIKTASSTLTPPVLSSSFGVQGGTVAISWTAVSGASDYLVYRITCSPNESQAPPASPHAQVAAACNEPNAPSICTMLPASKGTATPGATALFGYPSAPEYLTRVTGLTYSELAPNTLQSLYFVVAEDSSGNLSSPSNVVGGPSYVPAP